MNRFGVLNLLVAIGLVASVTAIDCNSKPDFRSAKDCCPHDSPVTNEITEKCKEFMKDDENEGPGGPGGHKGKMHANACFGECVMNSTGFVNFETMAIDEAKMKTYLAKALGENPDFIQVVSDAMGKCAEKGKEMRQMMGNGPKPILPPGGCKPCPAMFLHCVHKEVMINCPTSAWKNDETCNNVREFMMVCKPPHHGGPPKE